MLVISPQDALSTTVHSVDRKLQSLRQETALTRQFPVDSLAAITIKPLKIAFVLYKSAETANGVSAYSALQNIRHYGSFGSPAKARGLSIDSRKSKQEEFSVYDASELRSNESRHSLLLATRAISSRLKAIRTS